MKCFNRSFRVRLEVQHLRVHRPNLEIIDRRLGGVSPTGESFRFVRACVRAVCSGSGIAAKVSVPVFSLFPYRVGAVSLFPYRVGAVSLSPEWPKRNRSETEVKSKWNRSETEVQSKRNRSDTKVIIRSEIKSETEVKSKWDRSEFEVKSKWNQSETKVSSKWNRSETKVKSKWNPSEI